MTRDPGCSVALSPLRPFLSRPAPEKPEACAGALDSRVTVSPAAAPLIHFLIRCMTSIRIRAAETHQLSPIRDENRGRAIRRGEVGRALEGIGHRPFQSRSPCRAGGDQTTLYSSRKASFGR